MKRKKYRKIQKIKKIFKQIKKKYHNKMTIIKYQKKINKSSKKIRKISDLKNNLFKLIF